MACPILPRQATVKEAALTLNTFSQRERTSSPAFQGRRALQAERCRPDLKAPGAHPVGSVREATRRNERASGAVARRHLRLKTPLHPAATEGCVC